MKRKPFFHAQSLNLTIGNYQLQSSKQINAAVWQYTYTATSVCGPIQRASRRLL
jgi:hypothetical protein